MFKEKSSKKRIVTSESSKDHSTLDARHQVMIQTMHDQQKQMETFASEKTKIEAQIRALHADIQKLKEDGLFDTPHYDSLWDHTIVLKEQLVNIENTLKQLKSYQEEINYYEDTGYILFQYYDLLQNQDSATAVAPTPLTLPPRTTKGRKKNAAPMGRSILDAFGCGGNQATEDPPSSSNPNSNPNPSPVKPVVMDKSSLVDEYMCRMDSNFLRPPSHDTLGMCTKCDNVQLVCLQQEGVMVCPSCGYQELLLVEQNRPILRQSAKDATSHYTYRRINHFREWCSQVQGKESTDIPESVFEQILQEIRKEKIKDTKKITYNKMREILKKLKINKYYEHINYIINRINGVPTPHFSPELEEKLCNMFKEIQGPFLKHCPAQRKNFLSYSYVLSKFFQILGQTDRKYLDYCKFFPLLKSREKLYVQDQIFKAICEDLGWPVIPSL